METDTREQASPYVRPRPVQLAPELQRFDERVVLASQLLSSQYYRERPTAPDVGLEVFGDPKTTELDLQQHAWQTFTGALKTVIQGGDTWKNLQVVAVPSEVLWDDAEFGPYYFHKEIADLINEVGGTYRKTDRSFSERYAAFIQDVLRPPVDQQALADSRTALSAAIADQRRHDELVDNIQLEWQAFDDRQTSSLPPSRWIGMEDWYQRRQKNAIIRASGDIVLASWAHFAYLTQKAFGGGQTIATIVNTFANARRIEVSEPRTDSTRPAGKREVLPYTISPDFPTWIADARAQRHQIVRFSLRHDSHTYDYASSSIGAGIGVSFGFFGILAGGRRQTVQIDTRSSSFALDFEADLASFQVTPGAWYHSGAFQLFEAGPFFPASPMDTLLRRDAIFGPKGFISFRPARAIVAYKPKITVRLSKSEYHYFRQVTQGAAGFFVGPFAIGVGSYYDVRESVRWDNQNYTLELFNAPERPHLLAFDSQELP